MRNDLMKVLLAAFAAVVFNTACDDDGDSGGAGGGNTDMAGAGGDGGGGEDMGAGGVGGVGGGAGGMGGDGGMGGGAGGGGTGPGCPTDGSDTCPAACAWFAECGISECVGYDEGSRQGLIDGCLETCAASAALAGIVCTHTMCGQTVALGRGANPDFAAGCDDDGMGGAGGEGGGMPSAQIDRMGRGAITTALVPSAMKDAYNQDDNRAGWAATWTPTLTAGLEGADSLNGMLGDTPVPPAGLGPFLADDVLLLDPSKPYAADGYLHIELGIAGLLQPAMVTSGGRSLTQNLIDLTLSAVVGGVPLDSNWDCVDANDVPFPGVFPYLADPQ